MGAGISAPVSDTAIDDDLFFFRKFIHPGSQLLKRYQVGSWDGLRLVFLGRSYIQQEEILTGLYFFVQGLWSDILATLWIEKHGVPPWKSTCFLVDLPAIIFEARTMDTVRGY